MGVEPSKVVVDDLASSYCHAINSGQDHIQVQPNEKVSPLQRTQIQELT